MTYILPPYDPARPTAAPAARLTISSLALAATASGPFGRPFRSGTALAGWYHTASSTFVPAGPPNPFGPPPPANGKPPGILGWHHVAGGGQQLTFSTGHQPSAKILNGLDFPHGPPTGQVAVMAEADNGVIPVIATSGYLAASRLHIGSDASVSVSGLSVTVQIAASVDRFPTVLGNNRALVADLAEINDLIAADQGTPMPVTRW